MTKTSQMTEQKNRLVKMLILFLALFVLLFVLNLHQLYSAWAVWSETNRLTALAESTQDEHQNPARLEDGFEEKVSADFWKFTTINGVGEVSNELVWHATAITIDDGLAIQHTPDPDFYDESPARREPASERYNNAMLIDGIGFRPSPSADVVLKFTARMDEGFYGTAGVIVQPAGTLQENGLFAKPFDMFGFSVTGDESPINGVSGPLCYLALNWVPVEVHTKFVCNGPAKPNGWGVYRSIILNCVGSPCLPLDRWRSTFGATTSW